MKTCFKCGRLKPIDEFYKHPMMADGHLGKCRECAKADTSKNYYLRIDKYRDYERERNATTTRKEAHKRYQRKRRDVHPERCAAHTAVCNAVRDGRLRREPCERCGNPKSEGHHDDYSKPLDVRWLCFKHHRELHRARYLAEKTRPDEHRKAA